MVNLIENSILLNKHRLVYYESGEGIPILFVHGISTYSFIWSKVVPYFKDGFRVIVVDLLGCGHSDLKTDISFGIANQARFLLMLMSQLKIEKFHVVAHDVGGGVAQIMSVVKPHALLSVSLLNSVAYDFWPVQPIISMRVPILRQLAVATLDQGTLKFIVKRGLFQSEAFTEELLSLFSVPFKTKEGRKAFLHFAACLDNADLLRVSGELHSLDVQFLVVRGDHDAYLSVAIYEELMSNLKCAKGLVISSAGHYLQEDQPKKVALAILDFIREVSI